jgi:aspartate 1-decarboxylase
VLRKLCKGKIHRATVTATDIDYEGSITIDQDLLEAADILPSEEVQVVNINNGERFETYVFVGERGTGVIALNGAAARKAVPGDLVIIISYGYAPQEEAVLIQPKTVYVDANNKIVQKSPSGSIRITRAS